MSGYRGINSANPFASGVLANGTPVVVPLGGIPLPMTITLTSAAGGRLIELTTDGTNYFTPTYDATTAAMINVVVDAPAFAARVTGQAADKWNVR